MAFCCLGSIVVSLIIGTHSSRDPQNTPKRPRSSGIQIRYLVLVLVWYYHHGMEGLQLNGRVWLYAGSKKAKHEKVAPLVAAPLHKS